MKTARTMSMVALVLSIGVTITSAQQPSDETITKVVPIAHADARIIAEALAKLGLPIGITAAGPHTLILKGPVTEVNNLIRDVVGPMETPQTQFTGDGAPVFIPLAQIPNRDFPGLLDTIAPPGPSTRVAVDKANRLLVMRGSEPQIEAVRNLVSELDRPRRSAVVHAYFLKGYISSRESDGSLPSDLAPIAKTLTSGGVHGATLLAPVIVKATTGERFRSDGNLQPSGEPATLNFNVEGHLDIDNDNGVQLQLQGTVAGVSEGKSQLIFSIDTTVTTQTGSYVILAAAPGTTPAGDCIALVVRVEQAD